MSDNPKCCNTVTRRAGKGHHCCECHNSILKGQSYKYTSGIWDAPDSFKQCESCFEVSQAAMTLATREGFDPVCFGDLGEFLVGVMDYDARKQALISDMAGELNVSVTQIQRVVKLDSQGQNA